MDDNQQNNMETLPAVSASEKPTEPEPKDQDNLVPSNFGVYDEAGIEFKTIPVKKGDQFQFENFRPWQQKAFWHLYMKKETGFTLSQIAKMVGKSKETICRFGRSIEYRRIAGDTACLDYERLTPIALKRLEMILKLSQNEKLVAETAHKVIERGLAQRSLREKLDEQEKQQQVNLTQINIANLNNLNDLKSKHLSGMRSDLLKKLEQFLVPAEQAQTN